MVTPGSGARPLRPHGFTVLELLVSVSLSLLVLVAAAPLIVWSTRLAADVGARAVSIEGARLAALRLTRETRRAGFGLAPEADAFRVVSAGDSVEFVGLSGGFRGALQVVDPAPIGSTRLRLSRLGTLSPGDEVLVVDLDGRSHATRATGVSASPAEIEVAQQLPFPAGPAAGTCVFGLERRVWEEQQGSLLRDGIAALDPPSRLSVRAVPETGPLDSLVGIWTVGEAPGAMGPSSFLLAGFLQSGGVTASPAVRVALGAGARNTASIRLHGSPLP